MQGSTSVSFAKKLATVHGHLKASAIAHDCFILASKHDSVTVPAYTTEIKESGAIERRAPIIDESKKLKRLKKLRNFWNSVSNELKRMKGAR